MITTAVSSDQAYFSEEERKFVERERVRVFFKETNDQNIAGVAVLSLLVYFVHEESPAGIWEKSLFCLYLVTITRAWLIYQHKRNPERFSTTRWSLGQAITGGMSGICWAITCLSLLTNVSTEYQLLILTVMTAAAATNASEAFAYPPPSTAFIAISLSPTIIWLITVGDRLHLILALMLSVFMPLTIWQSRKRHRSFMESTRLRFRHQLLAEDLKVQKEVAEAAAKFKSAFLANMSHEIRTPLNGVLGIAQIGYRENFGRGRTQELFGKIVDAGEQLMVVINDILDISKIEAGKLAIEKRPFNLNNVIEDVIGMLAHRASEKGLSLTCSQTTDLPRWILGDAVRLRQILINLLSNAVKFTDQGQIKLITQRGVGDEICFSVSDQGIGMTEEQIARLFQPFEQADSSITRRYGGTGLGLAISNNLARLMDGEIKVISAPGLGSTFTITLKLPATEAHGRSDVSEMVAHSRDTKRLSGIRILAAEDNEFNQFVLTELLAQEGSQLMLVGNGKLAVEAAVQNPDCYDVVLMDVQMPEMDGLDATRRIRQVAPLLPIIGLTAHALEEEHVKCLAAGMNDVVTKPIEVETLVAAISRQCVREQIESQAKALPVDAENKSILNWSQLAQRYSNSSSQLLDQLLGAFLRSTEERPAQIRAAKENMSELARLAHSIVGSVGFLYAEGIVAQAREIEVIAKAGHPDVAGKAEALAAALEVLTMEVRKRLNQIEGHKN